MGDAREIVEFMRREGRAEWVGRGGVDERERAVAWIWWRNPEEWAGAIADWVSTVLLLLNQMGCVIFGVWTDLE